jgi:UDP-glucose 4-epimerase
MSIVIITLLGTSLGYVMHVDAKLSFEVFKTSSVGLRLFNVYGPRQKVNSSYSSVVPIFIHRILKKIPVTVNGGFQTRDFIYVQDVVDVFIKSMSKIKKKKIFTVFNVGTGRSVTINKLFNIIKKKIGTNPKVVKRKLEKFDPKKSSGTYKKIFKFLNLKKNNFTKLEDGLEETINYIRKKN